MMPAASHWTAMFCARSATLFVPALPCDDPPLPVATGSSESSVCGPKDSGPPDTPPVAQSLAGFQLQCQRLVGGSW
ncbi:hypothetical protein XELAEV_18034198mg [Xenopus laevis]|uniref:Secreted protein n=1 Tax=Xenopus laevis TaxID=8355 RepID=A0A974CEN6_XENLA|nr:hypothetical protein XELAEV_18034198mg [Xenopus laevis]